MTPYPILIDKIDCSNGTSIDICGSNDCSQTIKVVTDLISSTPKERFYDLLLEDCNALKLMTNALIDMKKLDETTPVFLFSSKLEKDQNDGKNSRREFSEQCKYQLNPEMRAISTMVQPFQQMVTSNKTPSGQTQVSQLMNEKRKKMVFCLNNFYGYSLDSQVIQGFIDRAQLIDLSVVAWQDYEDLITKLLQIKVCSIFQQLCWCKNHSTIPFAVTLHAHTEIQDIKCPICKGSLYSGCFVSLNPDFEPILKYFGGFLPSLIGWYFTKKNIEWTADVKIDQHEYGDIIFKYDNKYYLVECKIWSRNKNTRGLENCIEKAIDQVIDHIGYWESRQVNIERSAIFTNELDSDIFKKALKQVMSNKAQKIGNRKIRVYSIKSIPTIISEFMGEEI